MIGWEDVYKVVVAMAPLYFAFALGYGSVKWWHIFTREQCGAINRFVCYFTMPFLTLDFTSHVNPYALNYHFIAADAISKFIVVSVLAIWAKFSAKGSFSWSITNFSMCCLTNCLIVGVPLLKGMYGSVGVDLVLQSAVMQITIWVNLLILVLEFRKMLRSSSNANGADSMMDLEGNETAAANNRLSFWCMMKTVWVKLALHPKMYPCVLGITWAFVSKRWNLQLPSILEDCIRILSISGTGTCMFSLGMFMALQEKIIACGTKMALFGMILKFMAGPAAMAIGAIAVGLRGNILRIAIIQAALPQAVASFVWAKEYGLHAHVPSTTVIIGTVVSLPVLIAYYAIAESMK